MTTNPAAVQGIDDCWNRIGVRGDGSCPKLEQHIHCRNCSVYTGAADQLLDSDPPPRYLAEWSSHYSRPIPERETAVEPLFIFRLGPEWLALPVDVLREVAPGRRIHSLPHRQGGAVRGVANVRGELIPCLSLEQLLGIEAAAGDKARKEMARQRLLVIKDGHGALAFAVDEAQGIHRCSSRELAPVPATVARAAAAYTRAVLSWNGHSVGCLDAAMLMDALNRSLA
jgi:chemotaxis-related protein WspD